MPKRRHFGSVRKFSSGRYQAAYWHEGRRYVAERTFGAKGEAQAWLSVTEADILRGDWVEPTRGKVTFKAYAEAWRANQVHRPGTATQIETNFRRHVYPRIGDRPLKAIRPSEIQALIKYLATASESRKALAPATIEIIYTWVSTVFAAAVADHLIRTSPCGRNIRRPEVEREKVQPLPVETVVALIEAVPARQRALIVLGAGSGLRISEALGVTDDRVDWLRRTIKIDRQLIGVKNRLPIFGPVKDKKNRPRTIPIPQVVVDELAAHVAEFGLGPEGLLFTVTGGAPLRRTTFSAIWRRSADPLGIPLGDGYHQLRHFYASTLIRAGESVKVVQDRLGHTSATMTLDVYGHLWPEDDDATRAAVEAVLGPWRATGARGIGGA